MNFEKVVNNKYFIATLTLFLIVYATMAQLHLPKWLINLFNNDIFRVVYLAMLLMIPFEKVPHVAIIVELLFVIILHLISIQNRNEKFKILSLQYNNSDKETKFEQFDNTYIPEFTNIQSYNDQIVENIGTYNDDIIYHPSDVQ